MERDLQLVALLRKKMCNLVALLPKKTCNQWIFCRKRYAISGSLAGKNAIRGSFAERDIRRLPSALHSVKGFFAGRDMPSVALFRKDIRDFRKYLTKRVRTLD